MARAEFAGWLSQTNDVTATFLAAGGIKGLINLAGGLPDPSIWPVAELAGLARDVVLEDPQATLGYSAIPGLPELRAMIAARFSSDALRLGPENVLITTAGMQGLELVGKVLVDTGDAIAVQSPAYLGALDAWRPRLPVMRPLYLQAQDFDAKPAFSGAKFAYLVPNFSNPTGRLVQLQQRVDLIRASQETGTWLVEDDPYGMLYYDRAPLPSMLELSAQAAPGQPYDGQVVYLGTLSKGLAPGLRLGWVIAAPKMIEALAMAKQGSDMCTNGISQKIAAKAFATSLPERVLPAILDLYRSRRDALCAAMDTHLGHLLDWEKPEGGMFVWARSKDADLDTDQLLKVGLDHGVCVTPSSVFDPEGKDSAAMRINFTLNPPDVLEEGVKRLAKAISASKMANAA